MKKVFFFPSFLLWSLLSPGGSIQAQFQELPKIPIKLPADFREAFPDTITKMCSSTIDYNLDRTVKDVSDEYHNTRNCLANSIISQSIHTINQDIRAIVHEKADVLPEAGDLSQEQCDEDLFQNTRQQQEAKGLQTRCGETKPHSSVLAAFSPCRVAEMWLAEWCGYEKYLWGKQRDDVSFGNEFGAAALSPDEWQQIFTQKRISYQHESEKSKQALQDTLWFYQKFEHNYRLWAWSTVIKENLKDIRDKLVEFRDVIETYPTKFINAAKPG